MEQEFLKVTGELDIKLYDSEYNIKSHIHIPNMVVAVGKTFLASRAVGVEQDIMTHMAVGTSNSGLATSNIALANEIYRVVLDSPPSNTNNVITFNATFGSGQGTGALVEAGLFNSNTGGIMLARTTFAAINKEASDILTINWNVTIN